MHSIEDLAPLPDEHLASVVARFHRRNANSTVQQTLNQLFGDPRDAKQKKQRSLARFFENVGMTDIREQASYLDRTTVWPLKRIWRTFEQDIGRVRTLMSVSTNVLTRDIQSELRVRLPHWLFRFCPDCVRDDISHHGVAYWHRIHQINGVAVCPKHQSALQIDAIGKLKSRRQPNTTLSLPSDIAFDAGTVALLVDATILGPLGDVANNYASICETLIGFSREYALVVNARHAILDAVAQTTMGTPATLSQVRLFDRFRDYLRALGELGFEPDRSNFLSVSFADAVRRWAGGWAGAPALLSYIFETPERLQTALNQTVVKPRKSFPTLRRLFG